LTVRSIAKIGQGKIDESIQELFPIIENGIADPDIYMLRAKLHFLQNKIFLAKDDLKIVAGIDVQHPEISAMKISFLDYKVNLKNQASLQIIQKDFNLAVWYLNLALELEPCDWKLLLLRYSFIYKVGLFCMN
jgi:hypothetical protein